MTSVVPPIAPRPRRPLPAPGRARRLARFGVVSLVAGAVSQLVLLAARWRLGWSGASANLAGVLASVPLAYLLNRRLVWPPVGPGEWRRAALPFLATTAAGALLSTVAVGLADERWHSGLAAPSANVAAFGALWALRFALLDRLSGAPLAVAATA